MTRFATCSVPSATSRACRRVRAEPLLALAGDAEAGERHGLAGADPRRAARVEGHEIGPERRVERRMARSTPGWVRGVVPGTKAGCMAAAIARTRAGGSARSTATTR